MRPGLFYTLFFASILIIGCASSKVRKEIQTRQSQVVTLNANDKQNCNTINHCRYLKDVFCFRKSSNSKQIDRCNLSMRKETVKAGGDTLLIQLAETNPHTQFYTSYGQVYSCNGDTSLVEEAINPNKGIFPVRLFSKATIEECGLPKDCKRLHFFESKTIRGKPVMRVTNDLLSHTEKMSGNTFVINEHLFFNNDKNFRMNGTAYQCENLFK